LNTSLHWRLRGLGLGDPCGQGAAIGHAIAGNLLGSASIVATPPRAAAIAHQGTSAGSVHLCRKLTFELYLS
jgi:hypothetical protein